MGLLICYAGIIVLACLAYMSMKWENGRRDAAMVAAHTDETLEDGTSQAILDGFKDLTDMESKHFRYAL
jgi:hypothetical protein